MGMKNHRNTEISCILQLVANGNNFIQRKNGKLSKKKERGPLIKDTFSLKSTLLMHINFA